MRKGEVFFLVRFRQDLVSAVMKTLAVRGHDEQLGNALLDVKDLRVTFKTPDGDVTAVNDLNFSLRAGETLVSQ